MELQLASAMVSETERERERMEEQQRGERSARSFSQSDQRRGEHATNKASHAACGVRSRSARHRFPDCAQFGLKMTESVIFSLF